jgi:8-hydroxy-5-deazaflavin:NADPH oxidoreductase
MKIAVIGTGNVGGTLGERWRAAGHEVVYGSRSASGPGPGGAPVRTVGEAIDGAEVVLLAVPGSAITEVVAANGPALQYKVVIDAVNRIGEAESNSRAAIAAAAPQARYVRAFNSLGWENFADPPEGAGLFFAADPAGRPSAEELINEVGLEPVFVGNADASDIVDGVVTLWFALVTQRGGNRKLAFRVLTD